MTKVFLIATAIVALSHCSQPDGDGDSDLDAGPDSGDGGELDADVGSDDGAVDADGDEADDGGGDDSGILHLPRPESLLSPEQYDCRTASAPPERASTLPLGCFARADCAGLVVVAHRGSSFFAPENTLSAMRSAIALGVDMVEIDTRTTSDGAVVLLHDSDVDRTTEGTGDVQELTFDEVRALPLVLEENLPAGADFTCEQVPSLEEVLDLCRDRIDVMLDMKEGPVAAALVVEAAGMLDQVVMLASQSELADARAAVPGLLAMIRPYEHAEVQPMWDALVPSPTVVHIDPGFDDVLTIDLIHELGGKVLIDMWGADALSVFLGDWSEYGAGYERGLDIQQSEFPFYALWSVGRGSHP